MGNTIFKAFAKLNLSLNILPNRGERGYFNVQFLNVQAALHDRVRINDSPQTRMHINQMELEGESNIALRAARVMEERYQLQRGITIDIEKNIPLTAGLGGGSSDAAAVINGMDKLYHLHISSNEKIAIGAELGMDVCYCVIGGLCRVGGIGSEIQKISHRVPNLDLLIAIPKERKPSTSWAYSTLEEKEIGRNLHKYDELLRGIRVGSPEIVGRNLHNDFEEPIARYFPVTKFIKTLMLDHGALGAALAGSGLSVFGIFESTAGAARARKQLQERDIECMVTKLIEPSSS
jgi:4-diphosphocytidyl-2-C-methyl-D-erythritol kinase